jgi:hypothetical protein
VGARIGVRWPGSGCRTRNNHNPHMYQNSAGAVALQVGITETHHISMLKGSKRAENSADSNDILCVLRKNELGEI